MHSLRGDPTKFYMRNRRTYGKVVIDLYRGRERVPREEGAAIASVLSSTAGLHMGLPIGLHGVPLGALIALPFFLSMLPAEVFLYTSEIAECPGSVMMNASLLRTDVNPLPRLLRAPLFQLPWKIMPSPMQLKVLVSLETLSADLTYEAICCEKGFWR